MPDDDRVFLNAQLLKGIAHPIRIRLLGLLREDGPSTATKLGDQIGESSGVTSYHLRQLALHGLVEEDSSRGTGRERWWKAAHRSTTLDSKTARETPIEAEAYMRAIAARYAERVNRWLDGVHAVPGAWDESMTLSDSTLRLTAAQAADLVQAIQDVIDSFPRDAPGETGPEDSERVIVQYQVMPFIHRGHEREEK